MIRLLVCTASCRARVERLAGDDVNRNNAERVGNVYLRGLEPVDVIVRLLIASALARSHGCYVLPRGAASLAGGLPHPLPWCA